MNKQRSLFFIHMLMVVCAALVSTSFTVGAAIAGGLDPAALTLFRFFLASLLLLPYVHLRTGFYFSWAAMGRYSLISGSLVTFFWCMFLSLRYTTALNTSAIFTLVPSISGMYAFFLVGERLKRDQFIALVCGMAGALWVIFKGDLSLFLAMAWNKGDLIFLAGCFAMGLYTPLVRLLYKGEPMVVMTFWILVTGCGWLLVIAGQSIFALAWEKVSLVVWAGIGYLALFTTVCTFFLTQYAVPYIGPTKVMAYSYLYPGLVLLIDLLLGHGWPKGSIFPGIGLVLLAMYVIQRSDKTAFTKRGGQGSRASA